MRVANLDPAAERFKYALSFDIRDLISVDDVMSELHLGPNGALMYCMEYLVDNIDWLRDQLEGFLEDDYLLLDCPGQIELYSHVPVMKRVRAPRRPHTHTHARTHSRTHSLTHLHTSRRWWRCCVPQGSTSVACTAWTRCL